MAKASRRPTAFLGGWAIGGHIPSSEAATPVHMETVATGLAQVEMSLVSRR